MNNGDSLGTGDIFLDEMDRRIDYLQKIQSELRTASEKLVTRMAKAISIALNKSMSSYVDDVLAYRKLNFIDMISIKHQSMSYEEILIGFDVELDARIDAQIEALSPTEWMVFRFRDAELYYEKGEGAVVASVKADMLNEFGHVLDEHFRTKRMQLFLERYPWLVN